MYIFFVRKAIHPENSHVIERVLRGGKVEKQPNGRNFLGGREPLFFLRRKVFPPNCCIASGQHLKTTFWFQKSSKPGGLFKLGRIEHRPELQQFPCPVQVKGFR